MMPPNAKPFFIGIAGGTGSGKGTVAAALATGLPYEKVPIIDHEAYYRHNPDIPLEERQLVNYDHPDALDNDLMVEHLDRLRNGESTDVPIYDFVTHLRRPETRLVEPSPVVIVEGILVFVDPQVRKRLDMKVFVDTASDIRVFRRVRRDMRERGRTFDAIREQYYKTVRPMHLQFVEPSKRWADLIIAEGGNQQVALDTVIRGLFRTLQP